MRIVFIGQAPFGKDSLEALVKQGENVVGLITIPDLPGQKRLNPVKQLAEELGLPVLQPAKLKNPDAIAWVADLKPDPNNPRSIRPKNYEALKNGIKEFGNLQDIIYNETTGTIVGGHQRCQALIELGHEEAEVRVVQMSPERQRAVNIALDPD